MGPPAELDRRRLIQGLPVIGVAGLLTSRLTGCGGGVDTTMVKLRGIGSGRAARLVEQVRSTPADGGRRGDPKVSFLLLHGSSYDCTVWERIGVTRGLVDAGFAVTAVNLPGTGRSEPLDGVSEADWLGALVDDVGGSNRVVLVSPSASARYAYPYVASHPGGVAGWVPVGPAGGGFAWPGDPPAEPPVTVVAWGEHDRVIDRDAMVALVAAVPGARLEVMANAGHAAYEDQPAAFVEVLRVVTGALRDT